MAGLLTRSTNPDDLAEAKLLCEQGIAALERETTNKNVELETLHAKCLLYRVSHPHRNDPKYARDYEILVKQFVDQVVKEYRTEVHEATIIQLDGLAIASLEAGELGIAEKTIKKLREITLKVYGPGSPYIQRYEAMWGEYLVQSKQFDQAEKVLKEVLAFDQAKEESFAGGWDSFTSIRGNFQYGVCLRQRHEDVLALEHFEKAQKLLDERIEQMGTFQNRHMVEERCLILKPLQELYTELGYPQKAAKAQATIAELQNILDRIPR